MNNLGSRVTDVNQVAEQLLSSDNCNKDKIHQTRDQLNNRSELIAPSKTQYFTQKYISTH